MLLSAVSVLVVARSSSEIPEGLTNNPVYIYICLHSPRARTSEYLNFVMAYFERYLPTPFTIKLEGNKGDGNVIRRDNTRGGRKQRRKCGCETLFKKLSSRLIFRYCNYNYN